MYIRYNTHTPNRFEWDPVRRERTLSERGIDFVRAALIFNRPTFERPDRRREYGEHRQVAIGLTDAATCLTVVYTDRARADGRHVRRIISARRSNRRERQAYQNAILSR
jgi:uncharacterized DUF497 family protein